MDVRRRARRRTTCTSSRRSSPISIWWNAAVRDEFERILRFWFDRGVAGIRIDVAHALIKDRELRDGVEHMRDRPEVLEIYARWQEIARGYDPKPTLMGETYVPLGHLFRYASQLDLVQNFDFVRSRLRVEELRPIVEQIEAQAAVGALAALVRLEPRPLAASRRAGPAATSAGHARRCSCC